MHFFFLICLGKRIPFDRMDDEQPDIEFFSSFSNVSFGIISKSDKNIKPCCCCWFKGRTIRFRKLKRFFTPQSIPFWRRLYWSKVYRNRIYCVVGGQLIILQQSILSILQQSIFKQNILLQSILHCWGTARGLFPIYHDTDRDKAEEAMLVEDLPNSPKSTRLLLSSSLSILLWYQLWLIVQNWTRPSWWGPHPQK